MLLWHGSPHIVRTPRLELCRPFNDYGPGFYCTEDVDLAKEWACPSDADGFANRYDFSLDALSVLDLSSPGVSVLAWLALLLANRRVDRSNAIACEARDCLLENFLLDTSGFDVIRGYRADDSYFAFARAFLNNTISVAQLSEALRLGNLGEQVVLVSAKAFDRIRFAGFEVAPYEVYGPRRASRDMQARRRYQALTALFDRDGIYVRDLLLGEVDAHDPRLF